MPNIEDPIVETGRRIRLFKNGRNQALRIPREFELPGDEAVIHREGDRLIVESVAKKPSLSQVLSTLRPLDDEGLPEIQDPPATEDDIAL
jgi:antitoxin VapB